MSSSRRSNEQQAAYTRQAAILRKNLQEWNRMLQTPRGEDWPSMLGRLNAALNQTYNLNRQIDDVMEHFVYVPKQATANAQDIPFFLSTRLESSAEEQQQQQQKDFEFEGDPVQQLIEYEANTAKLVAQYKDIQREHGGF